VKRAGKITCGLAAAVWLLAGSAIAGDTILRGPQPDWLPVVAPHLSNRPDDPSRHVRYEVVESHARAFGSHTESYVRMRVRVLSPPGLQEVSQLAVEWNPALQTPTVHHARLIRAGETIDILARSDFTILRREAELERALQINGVLTGVLVNPDVRVGDTLDFAYSIRTEFSLFNNPFEAMVFPRAVLPADLAATTFSWPASMRIQTRAGRHAALPPISRQGDVSVIALRVTDAGGQAFPERMAPRSLPDHAWQLSSIGQWSDIADRLRGPFEQASLLPDAPDLAARVAQIRAEHATAEGRAAAALRLVQDEVRYMALTLGEGGWLPVPAAEVWASRLGDCKGKTVLLVALLRALGIDAEPVLVSSTSLPLDRYLPMVGVFDHVIVRARIGDEVYLLDGARLGDRSVTPDSPLVYEHVLPLAPNARLEPVPLRLPPRPGRVMHLEADFSDGVYSPVQVTLTDTYRGDAATGMQAGVAQVPAAELSRLFDQRWTTFLGGFGQVSGLSSQWEYHADTHEFVSRATARLAFDWGDGPVSIPLAHVEWKGLDPHEGQAFADADYATTFPGWSSFRTTIILPESGGSLDLSVQPYEVEAGATRYFRTVVRDGNRLETDRGSITLRPFATAAEIRAEQPAMDSFKDLVATMRPARGYELTPADRQTLATAPDGSPEVALGRGYVLLREGDHAGAVGQFDAAIAGFPAPHANALANRALAYLAMGDLERARADIAAAEAADPDDVILHHARGRLAEIEGDDLEAVLAFTAAIRGWPENTHALSRRAAAYERMGQSARALADMERVVVLAPEDPAARVAVARQLLVAGRAAEAHEQSGLAAQAMGYPDAGVRMFITVAQTAAYDLRASDPARAETVLTRALEVESDFPALLIDRAGVRETRGDTAGAAADRAEFTRLTRIRLDDPAQACGSRALLWHSRDAALALCDKTLAGAADAAGLHLRRGYLLYLLDRRGEALSAYRRAAELDPSSHRARYGLGRLLTANGQAADGDALMAAALAADPAAGDDFDEARLETGLPGGRPGD